MPEITPPHIDVLDFLGLKSRTLTQENVAAGWLGDDLDGVESFVEPLLAAGLVERREVTAHPLLDMSTPLVHRSVGEAGPTDEQFSALETFIQSRWTEEHQTFTVYFATKLGASFVGSYITEPPSEMQWEHDIHLGQLVIQMKLANGPEHMRHVLGEGALPKLGLQIPKFKDPDLFIVDEHRQAFTVIEFTGHYSQEHLRELDAHLSGEGHRKLVKRFPDRKYRLYPDPRGTEYYLY